MDGRCRTQVSLLPPPWEELTTSEPFRSATRVRPPGTKSPARRKHIGPKIDVTRHDRPSMKQGGSQSDIVGWAM